MSTATIELMLEHKSIRHFNDEEPDDETITTVVRAGQQAAFASQMYSVLLSRKRKNPFNAPLMFTICVDAYKMERFMARRDWEMVTNDLSLLLLGIQDASLMTQNMVLAGESLGLGSCLLGTVPYYATSVVKQFNLPPRVFPLVQLAMGYPAEDPPPRPRYPMDFVLFENEYPRFSDEQVEQAMAVMDEGYLAQDYYRRGNAMIRLQAGREETFTYDTYSWTEHISRKWGQRFESAERLLDQFAHCGFHLPGHQEKDD